VQNVCEQWAPTSACLVVPFWLAVKWELEVRNF
jgi:hypothetical protein